MWTGQGNIPQNEMPFPGHHLWVKLLQLSNPEKLLFFFLFLIQQFCRTSAGSQGTRCRWERVKRWFCSAALHPITEVQRSVLTLLHCLPESRTLACLSNLYCSSLCCLLSPCNTAVSLLFLYLPTFSFRCYSSDSLFPPYFSLSVTTFVMTGHRSTCTGPCLHIYPS